MTLPLRCCQDIFLRVSQAAAATSLHLCPAALALITWYRMHANSPVSLFRLARTHTTGPCCAVQWQVWRNKSQKAHRNVCVCVFVRFSPSLYKWRVEHLFAQAYGRLYMLFVCLWLTCIFVRISTSLKKTVALLLLLPYLSQLIFIMWACCSVTLCKNTRH